MKKNKTVSLFVLATLAAGTFSLISRYKNHHQALKNEKQGVDAVRDYFEEKGEIKVLYVSETDRCKENIWGGVVMESGQVYHFHYDNGQIHYEEEK